MELNPDFTDVKFYQKQLYETFKKSYEIKEIEEALDLLLGQRIEDEILVYPDDYINGI